MEVGDRRSLCAAARTHAPENGHVPMHLQLRRDRWPTNQVGSMGLEVRFVRRTGSLFQFRSALSPVLVEHTISIRVRLALPSGPLQADWDLAVVARTPFSFETE